MASKSVYVLGVRGFPQVQGGIESHCEHLYPYISDLGYDVTVLVRKPYIPTDTCVGDIRLKSLWSPTLTGVEAFMHTLWGVVYSIFKRPALLHMHAIGPSLFAPLARLFGLKVVCTHHGFDYEREKWGRISATILRSGEWCAAHYANEMIAVSELASVRLADTYGRHVHAINNGVNVVEAPPASDILTRLGLEAGGFVLSVSRIVEEKRQLDIINAYLTIPEPSFKLVIVGGNGGSDEYYQTVCNLALSHEGIVLAGFQSGADLEALFYHAAAFVHASSLEGNPIVLLEAMSYGLPIIASDIPPNRELALSEEEYFPLGDTRQLADKLKSVMDAHLQRDQAKVERARACYSWESKARELVDIYESVLGLS